MKNMYLYWIVCLANSGEIIDLSICAVGVALLVFRFCFLTSSEILSGSMEPTLMTGDYAIFQEFSLRKTYSLLCRILVVTF